MYAHGAPPRLSALVALAVQKKKQDLWQTYTADTLSYLLRVAAGRQVMPLYSDLMKEKQETDNRTSEQIISDLAERLRKDIHRRKEG